MPTREELHKVFPCPHGKKDLSDCSYCAIIRHAERADRSEIPTPSFRTKHDPPLTAEGMNQATEAGKYLKDYFEEHNMQFDKVIIECSPFMRCLQTAARIQEQLPEQFKTEIEINYAACEHLQTIDFPDFDPLPILETAVAEDGVKSQELRDHYDLGEVKFVDNSLNK